MGTSPGREPSDREIIIALWHESTAKPAGKPGPHMVGSAVGNLEKFACWAVAQFGTTGVLDAMGWTREELRRLTSTGFVGEGSTAPARSARLSAPLKAGRATEPQHRWNRAEWRP